MREWADIQGVHYQTAWKWFRDEILPVAVITTVTGTIVVQEASEASTGGLGPYARVPSHDQRSNLDRQVARLAEWAPAKSGIPVVRVEAEVRSGMNGARRRVQRLLADRNVKVVVVEDRDRLGRMNPKLVEAALSACGRQLVQIA
ncbi:MAG: recombinase family protein [Acidimicrobiales bacterium]